MLPGENPAPGVAEQPRQQHRVPARHDLVGEPDEVGLDAGNLVDDDDPGARALAVHLAGLAVVRHLGAGPALELVHRPIVAEARRRHPRRVRWAPSQQGKDVAMGLFSPRPEEPTEWAGLPSEPLEPRSPADRLVDRRIGRRARAAHRLRRRIDPAGARHDRAPSRPAREESSREDDSARHRGPPAQRDGSSTSLPIVRRARRSSCARRASASGYSPPGDDAQRPVRHQREQLRHHPRHQPRHREGVRQPHSRDRGGVGEQAGGRAPASGGVRLAMP